MNYLKWDEVHCTDVIYDTVKNEDVRVDAKFYNVYAQPMIVGESKTNNSIIRVFSERRYLKGGNENERIERID